MSRLLVVYFTIVVSPCFSQVDDFFNDMKGTSESDYQKIDSIQQIPNGALEAIRKSLPDRKKMPLLSSSEFLNSVKGVKGFLKNHTPRIFEYAFGYKNYIIIHYHLKIGSSRVSRILVARFNQKTKIDLILFMRTWDVSSIDKFHNLKRVKKRVYLELEKEQGAYTFY